METKSIQYERERIQATLLHLKKKKITPVTYGSMHIQTEAKNSVEIRGQEILIKNRRNKKIQSVTYGIVSSNSISKVYVLKTPTE